MTTILTLYKPRRHFSPSLAIIVHRLIAAGEACIMGNAHSRPHSLRCVPSPPPFHFVILCPAKGIPPHPFLFRLRRRLALQRDSINKVDDVRGWETSHCAYIFCLLQCIYFEAIALLENGATPTKKKKLPPERSGERSRPAPVFEQQGTTKKRHSDREHQNLNLQPKVSHLSNQGAAASSFASLGS